MCDDGKVVTGMDPCVRLDLSYVHSALLKLNERLIDLHRTLVEAFFSSHPTQVPTIYNTI